MKKKVLIIGGTSGLGKKLAELYIEKGCLVAVSGRRQNLLDELKEKFHDKIVVGRSDISTGNPEIEIKEMISKLGGLDLFIIPAAYAEFNQHLDWEIEKATIQTNVVGFAKIVNLIYQFFVNQNSGHIVTVTSTAASRANRFAPAYNASKAFQSFYTQGIRLKLKSLKSAVKVTELVPGYIDTDLIKGERLFWVAPVGKAAKQCLLAIERQSKRAFITRRWWLVYHIQRLMPGFIYDPLINGSWRLKHKKQTELP